LSCSAAYNFLYPAEQIRFRFSSASYNFTKAAEKKQNDICSAAYEGSLSVQEVTKTVDISSLLQSSETLAGRRNRERKKG